MRKNNKTMVVVTIIIVTVATIASLYFYQKYNYIKERDKMLEQRYGETMEQGGILRDEMNDLENSLKQKETEIEELNAKLNGYKEMSNYLKAKFHPDGKIYYITSGNIEFWANVECNERITVPSNFISDVVDMIEVNGKNVFAYLTENGLVYSESRVTLLPN